MEHGNVVFEISADSQHRPNCMHCKPI